MAAKAEEKLSEKDAAIGQECWEQTYYTSDGQSGRQSDLGHKTRAS